jgi:hypothetical protein
MRLKWNIWMICANNCQYWSYFFGKNNFIGDTKVWYFRINLRLLNLEDGLFFGVSYCDSWKNQICIPYEPFCHLPLTQNRLNHLINLFCNKISTIVPMAKSILTFRSICSFFPYSLRKPKSNKPTLANVIKRALNLNFSQFNTLLELKPYWNTNSGWFNSHCKPMNRT